MEKRHGSFKSVFVKNFTHKELDDSLIKCKLRKATGPDEVSSDMMIQLSAYGKGHASQNYQSGSLPNIWITANIIPIFKNGKPKNKVSSYRPISLHDK